MDEYIKREDAIKMIEDDLPEVVYYRKEDAIACLECLPTADVVPRNRWISVKDKLPEHKQAVLVYKGKLRGDKMGVYTYFEDDTWEDSYGNWKDAEDYGITHWMSLPTPPSKRSK